MITWPFRLIAIAASVTICWPIVLSSQVVRAEDRPAIEADASFTVSYFKGFLKGCAKEVRGDPDVGKIACSCAAAVVADRFTIDELKKMRGGGIEAFDRVHPGTSKLIGVCADAAAAAVKK